MWQSSLVFTLLVFSVMHDGRLAMIWLSYVIVYVLLGYWLADRGRLTTNMWMSPTAGNVYVRLEVDMEKVYIVNID